MYVCMYVCIYVCMYVCMYVCIYMYIHTSFHTYKDGYCENVALQLSVIILQRQLNGTISDDVFINTVFNQSSGPS